MIWQQLGFAQPNRKQIVTKKAIHQQLEVTSKQSETLEVVKRIEIQQQLAANYYHVEAVSTPTHQYQGFFGIEVTLKQTPTKVQLETLASLCNQLWLMPLILIFTYEDEQWLALGHRKIERNAKKPSYYEPLLSPPLSSLIKNREQFEQQWQLAQLPETNLYDVYQQYLTSLQAVITAQQVDIADNLAITAQTQSQLQELEQLQTEHQQLTNKIKKAKQLNERQQLIHQRREIEKQQTKLKEQLYGEANTR
ncbi:MAG: DUF4391 domain-containing protein [Culicoidibacterales bacterium]